MAYLSFYLTPEEFEVYQEEQEKQIRSSNPVNEWSCDNIEEANPYDALLFTIWSSLLPGIVVMGPIGYIGYIHFNWFAPFCLLIAFSIFAYTWYLTVGIDNHYDYVLSDVGLVQKQNRAEPLWVNKAIQIVSAFWAVGCLFAVAIAGPVVFAGSGILMLFAFSLMRRKPQNTFETRIAMREHWISAKYNKNRKVIAFYHKYDTCEYQDIQHTSVRRYHSFGCTYLFFRTQEELQDIVSIFNNQLELECLEVPNCSVLFGRDSLPNDVASLPYRAVSI
ncbi:hypothetical protein JCM19235_3841 [Vibrio maritimus]|uniref:Uncharacterized protein n=1 Tax=Vibrio maritimus TaxID=990268 RepID=A0A090S2V4_9VIBR|nr:hypothetical protein JCM19235_3841 [Vibrio maritimus]